MSLYISVVVMDSEGLDIANYVMDHDDPVQRRVLGEQCRNAFEAGQSITTSPIKGHSR